MKGLDEGQAEIPLRLAAYPPAHPEVGVYEVVRGCLFSRETVESVPELAHEREQLVLGHAPCRSGGEIHHPYAFRQRNDRGQQLAVAAGEDVDLVTHLAQAPGERGDIDDL